MKTEIDVTYDGEDKLFLHIEVGRGKMPDGRTCRLLQTNAGLHFQIKNKGKDTSKTKTYSVTYLNISKAISEVVTKHEKTNKK